MKINDIIFKELIKRGHSCGEGKMRVWDISDSKLWYLTPALSKGFLKLARYQPYRKTVLETEISLLKKSTTKIINFFGKKKFNLVVLGSGHGIKTVEFIKSLPLNARLRFCPVDISPYFIKMATERVRSLDSKKVASIRPFVSDFKNLNEILGVIRNGAYQNNLALLLGETISHYEINDFLYHLSRDMFKGDALVIGNGYRIGKRFVNVEKYKAPIFNEWFVHIMNGLGFNEEEVLYDARFANGRLEGFYNVLVEKKITHKGKTVNFRPGDKVIVAIQYKFFERELKKFCKMYFPEVEFLADRKREYCLLLCRK